MEKMEGYEPLISSTLRGKTALIVGLGLTVLGTSFSVIAYGNLPVDPPTVPPLAFALFGITLFTLPGSLLTILGATDIGREARASHGKRRMPATPWRWDYPWHPGRASDITVRQALLGLTGVIVGVGIIAPINYVVFTEDVPVFAWGGVLFLDLLLGLSLFEIARRALGILVFGRATLSYKELPLRHGDSIELTLSTRQSLDALSELHAELRYIEEGYESKQIEQGGQRGKQIRVVGIKKFSKTLTLARREFDPRSVLLRFDLPKEPDLDTRLSEIPPSYWDLVIRGDANGPDFERRFLLPVYSE